MDNFFVGGVVDGGLGEALRVLTKTDLGQSAIHVFVVKRIQRLWMWVQTGGMGNTLNRADG